KGSRKLDLLRVAVPLFAIILWFFTKVGGVSLLVVLGIATIGFILLFRRQPRSDSLKMNDNLNAEFQVKWGKSGQNSFEWEWKDWIGLAILAVVGYAIYKGADPVALLKILTGAGSS